MTKKPELKSLKNAEAALAGESMAYQKYLYFAKIARKNGDEDVAKLFEETAKHETRHAEGYLRQMFPMKSTSTEELLRVAAEGEKYEYTEMYPKFAQIAEEEGADEWLLKEFKDGIEDTKEHMELFQSRLKKLQSVFKGLARVEEEHYKNYANALKDHKNVSSKFEESEEYTKSDF
ncbi:MAG: rubrerythrin family protein [Bacteriovoracaceae bacterium]|nr:rubrerythrin family protein [Bacteriovoracaceae bacterium]